MSDPDKTLYDGDHETPFLCAPPLRWVDETTRASMTELRYRVRRPFYRVQERGSTNAKADGYLVEQPKPKIVGGDLLEFTLLFATVPNRPPEALPTVHSYQDIVSGFGISTEIIEIPVPLTALVNWRYYLTANPSAIKLARAYRIGLSGSAIYSVGTPPAKGAAFILHEDEQIERWKGDIWEVRSIWVPSLQFLKVN